MRIKRMYKSVLTAATVVAISLGMGSCTDNVDNSTKPSDNQQEQQAEQAQTTKAQKFWSVASQLVDLDDYTEDYEGKTFESTYGVTQGGDESTRYVYTNDAATAAARFADLVEQEGIDENTQSYTYSDPDVGTLIYNKGSGRILATVDVDIKQIPSLKKIVYVPGAYANGNFQGKAYYRFGDVVTRYVDDGQENWICVRPSFGPEGKGDSHWVCLNYVSGDNIKKIETSTNKTFYLPTGLGKNEEHMQNLAELLFAIYFPEEWEGNVRDVANTGLRMFHDFNKTNYEFHNQYFWKNVQAKWKDKQMLKDVLNFNYGDEEFQDMLKNDGLRLLYSGFSWWTWSSWNCTLYEATYKYSNDDPKRLNMHQASLHSVVKDMREVNKFDCRLMGVNWNMIDCYSNYKEFFDDPEGTQHYRWVVRHATGKELSSDHTYDKKRPIKGVEDYYRYYRDVYKTDVEHDQSGPEKTPAAINRDEAEVGSAIGKSGKFYKNAAEAQSNGDSLVAMVVYVGGDKRVEKGQPWNGLAIALKDAEETTYSGEDEDYAGLCTSNVASPINLASCYDGWAMTQRLATHACNANHTHPAAEAVNEIARIEGCSEWFIPSTGQWVLAMQNLCAGQLTNLTEYWGFRIEQAWPWMDGELFFYLRKNLNTTFQKVTMHYLCSTEQHYQDNARGKVWALDFEEKKAYFVTTDKYSDKDDVHVFVRPFMAFTYGNGGSIDPE